MTTAGPLEGRGFAPMEPEDDDAGLMPPPLPPPSPAPPRQRPALPVRPAPTPRPPLPSPRPKPGRPALPSRPGRPKLPETPKQPRLPGLVTPKVLKAMEQSPAQYKAWLRGDLDTVGAAWSADRRVLARSLPEIVQLVGAPLDPLPWDPHEYHYVSPPALPLGDRITWAMLKGLKKLWEELNEDRDEDEERKRLPEAEHYPSRQRANGYAGGLDARLVTPTEEPPAWIPARLSELRALQKGGEDHDVFLGRVLHARPLTMLQAWLEACGIRYFSAKELCVHKWRGPLERHVIHSIDHNAWAHVYRELKVDTLARFVGVPLARYIVPEPEDWPRILPVLIAVDRFRHWYGGPVTCISGFRVPSYNLRRPSEGGVGGAKDSRHMRFEAMDIQYRERDPDGSGYIHAELFQQFIQSLYPDPSDGVGIYKSFIHYDRFTRGPGSGKASSWGNRKDRRGLELRRYRPQGALTRRR